jgi:hypothetical protein
VCDIIDGIKETTTNLHLCVYFKKNKERMYHTNLSTWNDFKLNRKQFNAIFVSPTCHWCVQFLPAIDDATKLYLNTPLAKSQPFVIVQSDVDSAIVAAEQIQSFPRLIKYVSTGKQVIYNGDRSVQSVLQFLKLQVN